MKQSELNHLRRLLAWVRCEVGQDPDEQRETLRRIAPAFTEGISAEGQQRLVDAHDRARQVPKYVREAVKALARLLAPGETIEEGSTHPASDQAPRRPAQPERLGGRQC